MNLLASHEITSAQPKRKPYSAYKDTGFEWLQEIPSHWQIKRLKDAVKLNPDALPEDTTPDWPLQYVDIGNVDSAGRIIKVEELIFERAPSRARRKVRDGDSIISTVRTYLKAIAFLESPPDNLIVSTGFAILRPVGSIYPKFLWRMLQSGHFINAVVSHSEGVSYPAISPTHLASLPVWMPPLPEQEAIAAFLDLETAKIDALVAKKEQLIELLQEKRAAIITRAVTKGLPSTGSGQATPNVPMKDSGVEWLGEIPAHWTVIRMRYACSDIFLGLTSRVDYVGDGGFPLVRAVNISRGILDFSEVRYISEEQHRELTKYHRPRLNDVLLSKSGSIGTAALVETAQEFSIYESIFALRGHPELLKPKFLLYLVRSDICQRQYSASSVGMGVGHLNMSDIVDVRVALPTLSEQYAIAEHLDRETLKIDSMVLKVEEAIERLQEYRTALISAAVTGKIDVREQISRTD